MSVVKFYCSSG